MKYNENLKEEISFLGNKNINFYVDMLEDLSQKTDIEIVFSGTLSNGKSTVVNAILQDNLLQTGIGSTTAKITYISQAQEDKLIGLSANSEEFSAELTSKNIKEFNENTQIKVVKVFKKDFKYKNITFVDSPGINDLNKIREDISYAYVPKADAVVFVLDISKGITADEKAFFDDKVIKTHKDKIFILLNGLDKVANEDITPMLNHPLLQGFKVYAISAKGYLSGVLLNDEEKMKKSQFEFFLNDFESYIESIDSYKLLQNRINKAKTSIKELVSLQVQTQIENFVKSKEQIEKELQEKNKLLVMKEQEFQQVSEQIEIQVQEIQTYVQRQLQELEMKRYENENLNVFMDEVEKTVKNIVAYSGGKLQKIDIGKDFMTSMISSIDKYFDNALMILNLFSTKIPALAATTMVIEHLPFVKPYIQQASSSVLEGKIENILVDISKHFEKEISKLKQEKQMEIEYTLLAKVKTTIQALENSLNQAQIKKVTLENEIEKLHLQKSKIFVLLEE